MAADQEAGARWANDDELADHFQAHQWDTNCRTIPEYDASARATIRNGVRFTYNEKDFGRLRIGYYDPETGLLTVLNSAGTRIVSHFSPDDGEDYVLRQENSTYRRP